LLRVRFTGILQFAIAHTSWIGLVRIVSIFGAAALAATPSPSASSSSSFCPAGDSATPPPRLSGQNLGAKQPERAETFRLAHRPVQHDLSASSASSRHLRRAGNPRFTHDPSVVPLAALLPAHSQLWQHRYAYGMVMLKPFQWRR